MRELYRFACQLFVFVRVQNLLRHFDVTKGL
jgi:hypothetical protein